MIFQHARRAIGAALLIAAAPLPAQTEPTAEAGPTAVAEPSAAAPESSPCCTLPRLATIEIEIVDTMNSRANRTGDRFAIRLAEPVIVEGRVVVPAGTPGEGEVVHAARARAGGKAGELILAARWLDLEGTRIPLRSLRYGRSQGTDNSGAVNVGNVVAAAVLPIASVIGFLIAGGEVNIPAGTRANARLASDIQLAPID